MKTLKQARKAVIERIKTANNFEFFIYDRLNTSTCIETPKYMADFYTKMENEYRSLYDFVDKTMKEFNYGIGIKDFYDEEYERRSDEVEKSVDEAVGAMTIEEMRKVVDNRNKFEFMEFTEDMVAYLLISEDNHSRLYDKVREVLEEKEELEELHANLYDELRELVTCECQSGNYDILNSCADDASWQYAVPDPRLSDFDDYEETLDKVMKDVEKEDYGLEAVKECIESYSTEKLKAIYKWDYAGNNICWCEDFELDECVKGYLAIDGDYNYGRFMDVLWDELVDRGVDPEKLQANDLD